MCCHPGRNHRVTVRGDDVTVLAHELDLNWFRKHISSRNAVNIRGRMGPDKQASKNNRILNRVIEWSHKGIYYEADQRHA